MNFSSNINEFIWAVLNSLYIFFLRKDFAHTKSTKTHKKHKKAQKFNQKHKTQISEKK